MSDIILTKPKLDENQVACIDLLKEALAQALEGNVHAIVIAACMDGGFASVLAGNRPGDLNLACDEAKRKILDAVTGSVKTKATAKLVRGRFNYAG
jgi:hypothetical protein